MQNSEKIFGRKPVLEALSSTLAIEVVYIQEDMRGPEEVKIRNICKDRVIPLKKIPKIKLSKLVRGNHQGVIAFTALVQMHELETVLPFLFEKQSIPTILFLEGITDVRNFGAIARTAEVFGVGAIVVPRKNSAYITAEAIKTSAGALLRIPVCRVYNQEDALDYIKMSGFQLYFSSLDTDAVPLTDVDFSAPCAIVLGSEEKGVNPIYYEKATKKFMIPQVGNTDSLNVSVATGVILYECLRQRNFIS